MNTRDQNEATEANLNQDDVENNIKPESEKSSMHTETRYYAPIEYNNINTHIDVTVSDKNQANLNPNNSNQNNNINIENNVIITTTTTTTTSTVEQDVKLAPSLTLTPEQASKNVKKILSIYGLEEDFDNIPDEVAQCAICWRELHGTGDIVEVLPCHSSHSFHRRCLQSWFEKRATCPMCSKQFPEYAAYVSSLNNSQQQQQAVDQPARQENESDLSGFFIGFCCCPFILVSLPFIAVFYATRLTIRCCRRRNQ